MPKQIAIPEIINATLEGFSKAQEIYKDMSGGFWLWQAPEYFITTSVANKIHELPGNKYLTLEYGSSTTIQDAGAKGKGKLPKDIREKGRVDILLWWARGNPRAIIEIKNQIYSKCQYEKDIKRIKSLLKHNSHNSSLQFGIFAFYASDFSGSRKTAIEKTQDSIYRVFENSKEILGSSYEANLFTTTVEDDQASDIWQAACILVKYKNT